VTSEEIRKEREKLERDYNRLLPFAAAVFVLGMGALAIVFYVLHVLGFFR
jgi:hypothetical protein